MYSLSERTKYMLGGTVIALAVATYIFVAWVVAPIVLGFFMTAAMIGALIGWLVDDTRKHS